jgi:DNA-binding winged helix-turn-helix (wHTH) protein
MGVVRFDTFEVDFRSGELRKEGCRIQLAEQPFSVLALLLSQPGEVVTREELQKQLWPGNTCTDFDRGLNKAINRLRDALGDSAETPRFIETLPTRGYRFIGSVAGDSSSATAAETPSADDDDNGEKQGSAGWIFAGLAALVAVFLALWWLSDNHRRMPAAEPLIRSSLLPPPGRPFVPYRLAMSREERIPARLQNWPVQQDAGRDAGCRRA